MIPWHLYLRQDPSQFPTGKEFPGDLWSVLSGHKQQANDGRATEMREAWHEPQQPGTRRKKNALMEAVSEERECGIRRGGMRGAKYFMAVISLLLDSVVFHCPFSLFAD